MKKYSTKFWITFWTISAILLAGWYFFLTRSENENFIISDGVTGKLETAWDIFNYITKTEGEEKNFLVLIQNDLELRPGGGFIGAFGIIKTKDGGVADIQIHDTGIFDRRIPDGQALPYPFERLTNNEDWKLRDSNWSPDFPTNAQKAIEFYYLGQGQGQFDGVIAINTEILQPVLEVIGPITVPGYPGEYTSENADLAIEYQVEQGYIEQGIDFKDRKVFLRDLSAVIIDNLDSLSIGEKIEMVKKLEQELEHKNIMLYFNNEELQNKVDGLNWGGKVDEKWAGDYLMLVDANINAWKSDYYINRSIEYTVDLSADVPKANAKVTYKHTANESDWMTKDYQSYVRLYAQEGSWLESITNTLGSVQYEESLGKKVFGDIVQVDIGSQKTIEFSYNLPENVKEGDYELLIQKQSGTGTIPVKIRVTDVAGIVHEQEIELNSDYVFEF